MNLASIRVLLVEDNLGDARLLREALTEMKSTPFVLEHVTRLSEGLERLEAGGVDVVLLDLSLPDATGLDTVRRTHEAAAEVPIVVLTGLADEGFALRAVREGAQDYLVKGQIDGNLLVRSMRYAIERERLVRERTQAEKALQASREYALNIIDSSLDMIIAVDKEGHIIEFNPAAEEAFGYRHEEVLGKAVGLLYADPEESRIIHRAALERGNCVQEILNRRKNGAMFPSMVSASALRNAQGEAVGVMGISRDITERKLAELALQKAHEELEMRVRQRTAELQRVNEALEAEAAERRQIEAALAKARDEALGSARLKAEFLANMSHEIRTPMNGVIGMTNLLLNTDLNRSQREFAEMIRNSANVLLKIINDILDFSKIEAGKLTFEVLDFDLLETVESAVELLAERAQSKGLELVSSVQPAVPTLLRGDPVRLRQILTNLLANAVKFTDRGVVLVHVVKGSESSDEVTLRIEVKDTGSGIPRMAQAKLFQAFSQADGSTTRKYGGTGLGLAISKQLVTLMHGEIGVESAPGQGSTFWFTIRLRKQPNLAGPAHAGRDDWANARVLIVDDNETARLALQQHVSGWGMRADLASSGVEALESMRRAAAQTDPFKVAVLDRQMPGMDGLALARAIKDDRAIAETQLILLMSLGQRFEAQDLESAGISASLLKPVKHSRLFACLAATMASLSPVPTRRSESARAVSVPPRPAIAKARILLAEDNIINQQVALGQLRELGYDADLVANGVEVLETLRRQSYDIILMDCQMPEMDGMETTRRIRRAQGAQAAGVHRQPVHIIALTANAMPGDREECLRAGMNDYVSKPMGASELKAALERWKPAELDQADPIQTLRVSTAAGAFVSCPDSGSGRSASSQEGDDLPVDLKRVLKVTSKDPQKLRDLVGLCLTHTAAAIEGLAGAVQAASATEVENLAHKCCGASSSFGMTAIIPSLQALERLGRDGQLAGAEELRLEAAKQLDRIRRYFTEYLRSSEKTELTKSIP